jgi:hypothetical protein
MMSDESQNPALKHLSDEQILLLIENELSQLDAAFAREHLEACRECTERQKKFERSLATLLHPAHVARTHDVGFDPAARVRLQMRMRETAASGHTWTTWLESAFLGSRRYAVYASLLILIGGMMLFLRQRPILTPDGEPVFAEKGGIPDRHLTPGMTRPVALADICPLGDDDLDPTVPAATQRVVFAEYGIVADTATAEYQVDYLINPQLGGTNDVQNLWPEPYTSTVWNARVKDALEDRLHEMVCARTIDLASAQRDIATDWISAYKKYFHTPKPV